MTLEMDDILGTLDPTAPRDGQISVWCWLTRRCSDAIWGYAATHVMSIPAAARTACLAFSRISPSLEYLTPRLYLNR